MSMPMLTQCICAVCGKESEQIVLASTNRFGAPDLDLRPPEMMRSTMCWWIQECPYCGYISESLDDSTSVDDGWLKSEKFTSADGISFRSKLARRFYKYYLINIADEKPKAAFYAALHAAWACDDSKEADNAMICRRAALEQMGSLIAGQKDMTEKKSNGDCDETYRIVRMDLLRRTKQFSRVIDEYSDITFSSDILNQIKAFQIERAQIGDTNCYTVTDCTEE